MAYKRKLFCAIDCEFVGDDHNQSMLGQVSIVNDRQEILLNTYVKPPKPVFYYRTEISGITPENLINAPRYDEIIKEISSLVKGKIIIGFDMASELFYCGIKKNRLELRDLAKDVSTPYPNGGSLQKLASKHLNKYIQCGNHSSLEDAQTCMELYQLHPY